MHPVLAPNNANDKSSTYTENSLEERIPPCLTPLITPKYEEHNLPHLT